MLVMKSRVGANKWWRSLAFYLISCVVLFRLLCAFGSRESEMKDVHMYGLFRKVVF